MTPSDELVLDIVRLVFRYFWLLAVAVAALNTALLAVRLRGAPGSGATLAAYFLYMAGPFLWMGVCATLGNVPSLLHFFRPSDGNPWVLAWWLGMLAALAAYALWAVAGGEARLAQLWAPLRAGRPQPVLVRSEAANALFALLFFTAAFLMLYFYVRLPLEEFNFLWI